MKPRGKFNAPIPTIRRDEDLFAVSFDEAARVKRDGDAYSANFVLKARSGYAEGLTVNEADYHGLMMCLDLLEGLNPRRLVICGDSNLVIRQVRGEIDCKAPGLTLLRQRVLGRLRNWPDHELCAIEVEPKKEIQDLVILNRLDKILVVKNEDETAHVSAVTTRSKAGSGARTGSDPDSSREELVSELRIGRIRQAQDEGSWICGLKKYLRSDTRRITKWISEIYLATAQQPMKLLRIETN
ncbi:reverse transcriptase [Phytophthora megakarya]|uniref:Reverse transcriptase n=1 Tax=Phytophthora megakarya TaxID=4795 RepID=A0A225WAA7_9STRA|nr:reverse transcriptase [Phytophthora megakarya]